MIINLSEIMSVHDKIEHIEAPLELGSFQLDGINYRFAWKDPVKAVLSHLGGKRVLIEVQAKLALVMPCSRCLEDVVVPFDVKMSKEVDFTKTDEERVKELDETNYISGFSLDLELLVYDEILMNLPMKVLCTEECGGIQSYGSLDQDVEEAGLDPRMAVIRDIFNQT